MAILRIEAEQLGSVKDVRGYLAAVEDAYNGLYAFELTVAEAKQAAAEAESAAGRRGGRRRITVRTIRRAAAVVLPHDQLHLRSVRFESPGFWDFVGFLNPLETLRKYIQDRHERRKDRNYRERLEAQRMVLDNQKLKTEVVKAQVDLLRSLGVAEERIREIVSVHVASPLERLDAFQDSGLVETARLVDRGEVA